MRKIIAIPIVLLLLILSFYSINTGVTGFSTAIEEVPTDQEVAKELTKEEKAPIIVVLKQPGASSKITGFMTAVIQTKTSQQKVLSTLSEDEFEKKHEYSIIKGFSGEITAEGLEKLKHNPNVEKIYFDKTYTIMLSDTVPLINASKAHPYQINNQNITGTGETICILDTGINYTHESLGGCTGDEFLSGNCNKVTGYDYVNSDADPYDDHGHGTHVAGIAAAKGTIVGVAPDAKIAMIKVCDSAGSCSTSDIISGLEWCISNKTTFNISAISMSFGDGGQYTSISCPTDYADVSALAAAYAAGLFLVASSGNNGYISGVSYPACNENVTSAGATTKSDGITYNRGGDVLTILAPGVDIISTYYNGGTATMSGTSMSAPHIAGAAAIVQQYSRANSGVLTPQEVRIVLNNTGKDIYDSASGGTYSRISVYEAVKSLTDSIGPSLNIISPLNSTYNTNTSLSLAYTTNDINSVDSTWYNINGGENTVLTGDTSFDTVEGQQTLSLYANDSLGNQNYITVMFTTDLTQPVINLATQNDSYAKNPVTLHFSLTEQNPDSCSLYGSWNGWHLNQTASAIESSFTASLEDGDYTWNVECNDTANNIGTAQENYTIKVDSTTPAIEITSPQNTTYQTTNIDLNFSVTEQNLDSCWYSLDESVNVTIENCASTMLNVSENSHNLKLFINDSASNEALEEASFATDLTNPIINLESPSDSSFSNSESIQFKFKATDLSIDNCSLYGNWDEWHLNQTKSGITSDTLTSFDELKLKDGNYAWNVECTDYANNKAFNSTNYTLTIDATTPALAVSSPENTTYPDNNSLALNLVATDSNLDSCWYSLNNGANTTITNCENTTFGVANEQNSIKVYTKDQAGNEILTEVSFTADVSYPAILLSSPSEGASTQSPANFTYTVEDLGIANCSLLINGTVNSTDDSIATSFIQDFSITLTNNRYYWSIKCVDTSNKENTSEERNVIICTESWNCTEWNTCSSSQQTRACTDLNSCATTYSKPAESQSCSSPSTGITESPAATTTGAASSGEIFPDEEEEISETPKPSENLPENKPAEEKQESPFEVKETVKEEVKEGFTAKIWNALKSIKGWVISPKQTAMSISTRAVDTAKGHKIAVSSFVFVIAMMLFAHFYVLKRYRQRKGKEGIPKPDFVIPPKIKDVKAKFKGVSKIKESEPLENITPPDEKHESIFKSFDPFKSYKELLKQKKP